MGRVKCYAAALVPLCLLLVVASGLAQSCGKRKVVNFLIVNGTEAKDGYWPWHVALFHNKARSFVYACGGTILDQNTVLTAAQCLMTSNGIIPRERLVVQVGRNRLRVASNRAQEHKAFQLIVHPDYNVNGIRHDIALIKLATDITYTDYIQPICLWNRGDDQNAIVGSWGTVIGFGVDESDNPSDTLREARIPVVSAITCIESNRESFATRLTSDMFCAGNRDGIGPCNGDAGEGLFFNYNDVWYIRGLVSFTLPRQDALLCDTKEYTVFTDVAKYLKWIKQSRALPPTQVPSTRSSALSCGTRKVPNFLIVNGTEAKDGHWPWHVALFHNNARSLAYVCGGTILDQNTVLTAARCLMASNEVIPRERLVVQVGRNRLHVASNHAQEHVAYQLIVHPDFSVNSVRHNIALIKLATDITYTDYIQPICLWNRGEDQNAIVGSWGTVIGFGVDESDNPSDTLREARIPVVSAITCIESNRKVFATQLTSDMFCAGNRDGIGPCNGDAGEGLFFNYNDVWYIRGLVSFTQPRQESHLCDTKEYTVFTDVAKYLKWIKQSPALPPTQVPPTRSSALSCGTRKVPNFLIVNGNEAKDGHWPWHAALFHSNARSLAYVCGGTILDPNTILTAAHCLMLSNGIIARERLVVKIGRNRLHVASNRGQEHVAYQLIVHPDYNVNSNQHDIGLIKLATDITYTDYIQPICLWNRGEDQNAIVGSWGTVIGFGIDETDILSDTLREARIPIVSAITCIESNREAFASQLTSNMFCAGNRDGIGASNGDSGGGLFFNQGDNWFIRGIVSFSRQRQGTDKGDTNLYTVFTDVAKYLKWIELHMRGTSVQPVAIKNDSNHKIRLLPMSTCGANPYAGREESSKPVLLGYPWMGLIECATLEFPELKPVCQATLISDRYLITPAICERYSAQCDQLSVRLGEYDRSAITDCDDVDGEIICAPPVQTLRIESVITHKSFNERRLANNIALIRLRDRADTSRANVKPICLPVTSELRMKNSDHYIITTWNYDFFGVSQLLGRLLSKSIELSECQKLYTNHRRNITSEHICVKLQNEPECKIPFGGAPLQLVQQVLRKSRYVLYGVLSHGSITCSELPDAYTNVASHVDWILETIQE